MEKRPHKNKASRGEQPRRSILLVGSGGSVTTTRRWVLEHAGYAVTIAGSTGAAISALRHTYDLLLFGVITRNIDGTQVIQAARERSPKMPILGVAGSHRLQVDRQISAAAGPGELLRTVGEAVVAFHGHSADPDDCVMFVDPQRRYFHVTDAAAELVGYKREELLGRKIDDISAPDMDVPGKFRSYVRNGVQHGVFSLKHRTGEIVRVRYAATVLNDGCMVSRLKKLQTS